MNRDVAELTRRMQRVEEALAAAVPLIAEGHVRTEPCGFDDTCNVCASCGCENHHELDCPMRKLLELVKGFQG